METIFLFLLKALCSQVRAARNKLIKSTKYPNKMNSQKIGTEFAKTERLRSRKPNTVRSSPSSSDLNQVHGLVNAMEAVPHCTGGAVWGKGEVTAVGVFESFRFVSYQAYRIIIPVLLQFKWRKNTKSLRTSREIESLLKRLRFLISRLFSRAFCCRHKPSIELVAFLKLKPSIDEYSLRSQITLKPCTI